MGKEINLDNVEQEKKALLAKIDTNTQEQNQEVIFEKTEEEQPKKEESSKEQESEKAPEKEEETKPNEKYEGKTKEEVIKMHEDATKKITELSQKEVKEETDDKEEKKTDSKLSIDEDSLKTFKSLFSGKAVESVENQTKEVVKAEKEIIEDKDLSNEDKSGLLGEIQSLKKLILEDRVESSRATQIETQRLEAKELLANDKVLPWSDEVESMLEKDIFANMPQLKSSQGGYIVAHMLLKGLLAKGTVVASEAEKDALVAKETKPKKEPEYDPSKEKDLKKLRSYLARTAGVAQNN